MISRTKKVFLGLTAMMTKRLKLVIDGVPVPKGRPRFTKAGVAYTPAKTRDYEKQAAIIADIGMRANGLKMFECPVTVMATAYLQIPKSMTKKDRAAAVAGVLLPAKKPDIDNIAKAALDGLNGIVWRDDSLIVGLSIKKRYSERPRLEIDVYTEAA